LVGVVGEAVCGAAVVDLDGKPEGVRDGEEAAGEGAGVGAEVGEEEDVPGCEAGEEGCGAEAYAKGAAGLPGAPGVAQGEEAGEDEPGCGDVVDHWFSFIWAWIESNLSVIMESRGPSSLGRMMFPAPLTRLSRPRKACSARVNSS